MQYQQSRKREMEYLNNGMHRKYVFIVQKKLHVNFNEVGVLITCQTSLPVTRLLNYCLGGQTVSRSLGQHPYTGQFSMNSTLGKDTHQVYCGTQPQSQSTHIFPRRSQWKTASNVKIVFQSRCTKNWWIVGTYGRFSKFHHFASKRNKKPSRSPSRRYNDPS